MSASLQVYLFLFIYFFSPFFSTPEVCQYVLDLYGRTIFCDVEPSNSLENSFELNKGEHRLLYNLSGPPAEIPQFSYVTV